MRPIRAGQVEGRLGKKKNDVYRLEYGEGGFGVPAGVPMRPRRFQIPSGEWSQREYFDRPTVVYIDTVFAGQVYWLFCGPITGDYCPFSPASSFVAENARPGQPIFINRPGEYNFYAEVDPRVTPILQCRAVDAAFLHVDKAQLKHLVGYDPTLGVYRTIGSTAADPAALWTYDAAVVAAIAALPVPALAAATPAVTEVVMGGASAAVLAANVARKMAVISNPGGVTVFISDDGTAALVTDHPIYPGGSYVIAPVMVGAGQMINQAAIAGITAGAAGALAVTEWT